MRLLRSSQWKADKTQVERPASKEGSICHSHGSSAKAVPPMDKLSGKAPKDRRKPRQSQPAPGPGRTGCSSLTELAMPISSVSAFCQAVLSKVIPHGFYGTGQVQLHNRRIMMRNIDRFIRLRRFETISLHEVLQGWKAGLPPQPQASIWVTSLG